MARETKPIYFGPAQESGAQRLAGASPIAINVIIDGRGTVRRRPGLTTYSGFPSAVVDAAGITGLYVAETRQAFAVGAPSPLSALYLLTPGASAVYAGNESAIVGGGRPTFAETDALVVIAARGPMQKIVLADNATSRLGGNPPPASHVVASSLRLLGNDLETDRSKVRYSDLSQGTLDYSGHEMWTFGGVGLSGFFTAEARPDPVQAIGENSNEVFVWGTSSVQTFAPDGQLVYAPVSTREHGLLAPYSVIKHDESFAWLDHRRRFVVSDGREYKVISGDVQEALDALDEEECFGYRVQLGSVDALIWTFPNVGVTYAYQMGGGWSQWQGAMSGGAFTQFPVTAHHYDRNGGGNLIGTSTGRVGRFQLGLANDFTDDRIVSSVTTGYLDRETSARKWCQCVRITVERGTATSTTAPVGFLRYSDAPGHWSAPIAVSLGASGDTVSDVEIRSLGVYRRRAWRFEFSGETDLALVRVAEEYEVLPQ